VVEQLGSLHRQVARLLVEEVGLELLPLLIALVAGVVGEPRQLNPRVVELVLSDQGSNFLGQLLRRQFLGRALDQLLRVDARKDPLGFGEELERLFELVGPDGSSSLLQRYLRGSVTGSSGGEELAAAP